MITTIAITGHRPDSFLQSHYSLETIKRLAEDTIFVLKKQYDGNLMFNVGGAIGTDQWAADACIALNIKYKIYLPFTPEVQSKFWSEEHKSVLRDQIMKANGLEIVDPTGKYHVSKYQERNKRMVDDANFVLAFWVGKRKGGTYNCIKYALKQSKLVYNALEEESIGENKFLVNDDIINGWTPRSLPENL